jgi:hypothetical protein
MDQVNMRNGGTTCTALVTTHGFACSRWPALIGAVGESNV